MFHSFEGIEQCRAQATSTVGCRLFTVYSKKHSVLYTVYLLIFPKLDHYTMPSTYCTSTSRYEIEGAKAFVSFANPSISASVLASASS